MGRQHVNILAIVPYFVPHLGGGETHLYQMAELLSAKGHSITILTQGLPGAPEYEGKEGIKIRRFGNALTRAGRHAGYTQILAYVEQHEFPDTVLYEYLSVGREYRTKTICEILALAREKDIPRVVRIPSSGRVTELSKLHPDGIKELREADCVIALNPGIYKELVSFGVHPYQIQSIPNGVNINLFKPSRESRIKGVRTSIGCTQDTLVFLCPSRFAPKKRIPELLRLYKRITENHKITSSYELWVVGDDHLEAEQRGRVSRHVHALAEELKLTGLRIFPAEPVNVHPKCTTHSRVMCTTHSRVVCATHVRVVCATGTSRTPFAKMVPPLHPAMSCCSSRQAWFLTYGFFDSAGEAALSPVTSFPRRRCL